MSESSIVTAEGQIFIFVVGSFIVAFCIGIVTWVKKKAGCQDKLDARSTRQSHALIYLAQSNDDITARLHPTEPKPNSAEIIEKLLKDEYGNL